jgi:hypothetical protein
MPKAKRAGSAKQKKNTPRPAKTTPGKRRAPRTAWQPGQSGNPRGRPPVGLAAAELVRRIGDEVMVSPDGKVHMTRLEGVVRRMYLLAGNGNVQAATILFNRGWGMPPQTIEGELTTYTPEQLEKQRRSRMKAVMPALARMVQRLNAEDA